MVKANMDLNKSNDTIIPQFDNEKNDSLRIILEKINSIQNGIFVYLNGCIDTYNSNFFQNQIQKIINAGFKNIIFNCSALNYISSTGIGAFTFFLKEVKSNGGDIVLLEIQDKVREVFQLLGFLQFFNIKNTLEEAMKFFSGNQSETVEVFPKVFACPFCKKNLRATRPGRFRCSGCKSIIALDDKGAVSLG